MMNTQKYIKLSGRVGPKSKPQHRHCLYETFREDETTAWRPGLEAAAFKDDGGVVASAMAACETLLHCTFVLCPSAIDLERISLSHTPFTVYRLL